MDLAQFSDGVAFDPGRLAASFEAVRRASEPFSYPEPGAVMVAPIVFGPGPAERLMTPLEVTVANLEASMKAAEEARTEAVRQLPLDPEIFETIEQRRARTIRKFGYAC